MTRKIKVRVADFETTTTADDCRVWAWGIDTLDETDWKHGTNIESFVSYVSRFKGIIYFHNLKFDSVFIIYYLLTNGYTFVTKRHPGVGQFTLLMSEMGQLYTMKVGWLKGQVTEFRDSAKKFPNMSVSYIAEAFGQVEHKGDIDYHAERPVGHELTPEELDYLKRDVHIICRALKDTFDSNLKKLTIGSDALFSFKELKGSQYEILFPTLGTALDAEIRKAYRGGYTFCNPRYSGVVMDCEGVVLDVNSLYPYIMKTRELPFGEPEYISDFDYYSHKGFHIFPVTFIATLKEGYLPCIQVKNSGRFAPTDYLTDIDEPVTLYVTNVDWELYNEHYFITVISFYGAWKFQTTTGIFNDYIDYWADIKANSTGAKREIAKLMLNSLYGKFGSATIVRSKYPILENDVVKYKLMPDDERAPVYTPMAVFITSWARDYMIRCAQENYDVFAYGDTDSLHLLTRDVPDSLDVHPTKLGAWKLEYKFTRAIFIRAKAYAEDTDKYGELIKIAGLPKTVSQHLKMADLFDGAEFHGKLVPRNVSGGVILVDTPYKLDF